MDKGYTQMRIVHFVQKMQGAFQTRLDAESMHGE
jgi:hypothetical protein